MKLSFMIKAVIIDDEPKAIQSLAWELNNFESEVKIVATFSEPEKALSYINDNTFDCLFLDIEMPSMDGFQLLDKINKRNFFVVITTAYNEYAIKALKKDAIDYLLKPIDSDDLKETITKIKNQLFKDFNAEKIENILIKFNNKLFNKKITITSDGKLIFLKPDDIYYVISDGNYSTFFLDNQKKIVVTKKLKEINELLPQDSFFRIHNSYIVNLHKIKEFLKTDGYVILENNIKIPVSRQKKTDFLDKL